MKVIKRNGKIVDFDKAKITLAIEKANKEVRKKEKAGKEDIKTIIAYIEELDKKRILVEDIQDIIEQKLMELGKYELAKKYIVYRYTRALVRKSNTTDESILGLIRNKNKEKSNRNVLYASTQRDYIAGEVSRDLTKRLLLPEKISKAEEEGILYFHDADYFVQPIINSCLINIEDMLENGTVLNQQKIENPKNFLVACTLTTQIIISVASNTYGEQAVELNYLGKYLRKSREKFEKELKEKFAELSEDIIKKLVAVRVEEELKTGIQTIMCQINTITTTNGKTPHVVMILNLEQNEYIVENSMIIEEIFKQKCSEKNNLTQFPKLVYVLNENNCLNGSKYDNLTKMALKCIEKNIEIGFLSEKNVMENGSENIGYKNYLFSGVDEKERHKIKGKFNQGIVSINLPQIGIIAEGNEDKFWKELEQRLELCKEALMCRHCSLIGVNSETSAILWKDGAIARLKDNENIDKLLYEDFSTISLCVVGLYELTKIVKGATYKEKEGFEFATKVAEYLKEKIKQWTNETNVVFSLYNAHIEEACYKFAKIDRERFGTIPEITDKGYYTNFYYIDEKEEINIIEKIKIEKEFQKIFNNGGVSYIKIEQIKTSFDSMEDFIKFIYENLQYIESI